MLNRSFIAAIAAAFVFTIAGGASSTARADDDLVRALAGLTALAIIVDALDDDDDRAVIRRHAPKPVYRALPRHQPRYQTRYILPTQCLVRVQTRNGQIRNVYGQRCLNRNFTAVNRLPQSCLRQVEGRRGVTQAYGAGCLSRAGYRTARN